VLFLCLLPAGVQIAAGANLTAGLKAGKVELKSAGALAFGPEGILFVGDSVGGAIYALDTGDRPANASAKAVEIGGFNEKIAALLGTSADQILINDLAVNPISKRVYVSVSRGRGPDAVPVLLRADGAGKLEEVSLNSVPHARANLPNAPDPAKTDRRGQSLRLEAITDLAYVENKLYVAGLSNEEFASNLRAVPFPFEQADRGASVEIYHGSHGRFETNSPVRTFVRYEIKNEPYILAAYTCTPLVKFPVSQLKPGTKVVGKTIAELGNRNRPLDMIVYSKSGKDYLLMNNSSRGVMKMSTEGIADLEAITAPTEMAGLKYETIADLKNVQQLDLLDRDRAVILAGDGGSLDLKTIALP
jgi:hypothetical protein